MKKKYVVWIVIAVLVVIGLIVAGLYNNAVEDGKEYEVLEISEESYQYFILKEDNNYGVMNSSGDILISAQYDNIIIPNPQIGVFVCYEGEDTKVLNENGEEIYTDFSGIEPIRLKQIASSLMYEKNILTYESDGKYGLMSIDGNKLTSAIFDSITGLTYKEGELLVEENGKYGIINNKGKYIIRCEYDSISVDGYSTGSDGYKYSGYIVSITTDDGYRYGYKNSNGDTVLETKYNDISRIVDINDNSNAYLIVSSNGQYGLYVNGAQVIDNEYQSISYNTESDTLTVEKTKKYGVATLDGELIIQIEYSQIDCTGIYIYATRSDGTVAVFEQDGTKNEEADSNVYISETSNDEYRIKIDNTSETNYSVIDKNANQLTTGQYSYMEYLYDDYFIVSVTGGKVGVIDINENQIIPITYDSIQRLSGTDCIETTLTSENSTQIYNKKLTKICDMTDATVEVKDEYIKIYSISETEYFDLNGNEKKNTEVLVGNTIYADEKDGKWGFVNASGNVVVDYIYDKATDLNSYGYAGILINNQWGVVDSSGNIVVKPKYELSTTSEPQFLGEYYKVTFGYGEFYFTK